MRADEKLTAFVEVESAIPRLSIGEHNHQDANRQRKESEDSAQDHARVRPCKTLTGINKVHSEKGSTARVCVPQSKTRAVRF